VAVDDRALARSLRELTATITPVATVSEQLHVVVGAAAELLGVDCVGVLLLDDLDRIRTVAASGPAAAALEAAQEHLQAGPGVDVLTEGRVLRVDDLAAAPGYGVLWSQLSGAGVRGVLSAPVVVRGEVVGNLNAVTAQRHHWSAAESLAAEAFASLIGQLLHAATSAARPDGAIGENGTGGENSTAGEREEPST